MRVYFAESLETFTADLQRARPTVFFSVPRLWVKFQQGVQAKMPQEKLDRLLKLPIIRGIVKNDMLYLHNFEPSRWPACNRVSSTPCTTHASGSTSAPCRKVRLSGKR